MLSPKKKPNNTNYHPEKPRYTCKLHYVIPVFTPAAHAIVVKRLMHNTDKIHHIIDLKMNGQAGILSLFWKLTYENRRS
ncbi:hypothetical protein AH332_00665 [Salmonella enterica subsp. salamae]|nr:hypothetical protein [Salmonella enterica subsp. salamae]